MFANILILLIGINLIFIGGRLFYIHKVLLNILKELRNAKTDTN